MIEPPPLLLTVREVADLLGVSRAKVYNMVQAKTIPALHIGPRVIRIPHANLAAWLQSKKQGGDDGAADPTKR